MSNKKSSRNVICAVMEQGTVGIKLDDHVIKYVRFTKLTSGEIAVCINNKPELSRVSYERFELIAKSLDGKIAEMHA